MRGRRGSLPLLDALAFLAIASVAAALVLSLGLPADPPRDPAQGYARQVLDSLLRSTLRDPWILADGLPERLDPGPVAEVLGGALARDLEEDLRVLPLAPPIGDLLDPLVREDWAWAFQSTAADRFGERSDLRLAGGAIPPGAEYVTAVTETRLGDPRGTTVTFLLLLVPSP